MNITVMISLLGGAGDLVSRFISRVISTLNGVTPIITLLRNVPWPSKYEHHCHDLPTST